MTILQKLGTVLFCLQSFLLWAQPSPFVSKVWVSDIGNGSFNNPVLYADYSDPDAIRVGDDYYMVSSSFNCVPGLPILHSKDLINWNLIGHALPRLVPNEVFDTVQHGGGVWAPCIRYHNNLFYIFYPDPDFGIYRVTAQKATGPWSEPVLVQAGKGLIDPSPLWDDDGKAYLAYAFAGSRAGVKSVLMVSRMEPDGTKLLGNSVLVFDGQREHPTVEGPKFYKHNGYYYIFAPAGGVSTGWQLVLRSQNIWGPYEAKTVMAKGRTDINGPHQGAWIETQTGEHWFLHFQDLGPYGRVVHLNPMQWVNDWPIIGIDMEGKGIGEPQRRLTKPLVGKIFPITTPPDSDEFNSHELGLQWQWQANPQTTWGYPSGNLGFFRLNCTPANPNAPNLWKTPNLLLQKFPAPEFTATVKLNFNVKADDEEVGLIIMGLDYGRISIKRVKGKLMIVSYACTDADKGKAETFLFGPMLTETTIYLRAKVESGARYTLLWSRDGRNFTRLGSTYKAREGKWIGAKIGLYALRNGVTNDAGSADIDWFRVER